MSTFFTQLPSVEKFEALAEAASFHPVPDDWLIVCADVIDSTRAIAQGRYKEVNLLGAAVITAVLNLDRSLELPFFFAGDGSCVLVPPELAAPAARVLPGLRRIARDRFELPLRADLFSVARLRAAGADTRVARFCYTANYHQAMFAGDGLAEAERLLKAAPATEPPADSPEPDLAGLECRWQGIASPRGEIISLLVQAQGETAEVRAGRYRETLAAIERICGTGHAARPTNEKNLRLNVSLGGLEAEAIIHHGHLGALIRKLITIKMAMETRLAGWFRRKRSRALGVDWGRYFDEVVLHTDYRKFDNMLRMVLSCTPDERQALRDWLDAGQAENRLSYGLHVSSQALLTCVVLDRADRHFHFVDGAGGGYAAAATEMKSRTVIQSNSDK